VRRKTTERDAFWKDEDPLVFARSYLSHAFPNSERADCPTDDALQLMATRPSESDASISEHLTCCSPCFNAYMGHLAKSRAKIRKITWIKRSAAALGVAAVLAVVSYLFFAKHRGATIIAPRNQAPTIAPEKPDQTQTAASYVPVLIDLSNASPTRGSKQSATRSIPQVIPSNSPVALSLRLPLGSEERLYSVTLTSRLQDVWTASSQARREKGDTLLQLHADFRDVSPGSYTLQVSSGVRRLSVPVLIQKSLPNNNEQQH
jgi:hypothetical protein